MNAKHTTDANVKETSDAWSLKIGQAKNRIDKLIEADGHEFDEEGPAMQELVRLIGYDKACVFVPDKLKLKIAQRDAAAKRGKASLALA